MISPDEIKNQALKWWKAFLQSIILEEQFFPKSIERIGKVQSGHITRRFETLRKEVELLYKYSKNQTGSGYLIKTTERNFRRTGSHELPDIVLFETDEDYIAFIGRKKEWSLFVSNYGIIKVTMPQLRQWALQHCLWLTESHVNWTDILKVCSYFIDNPRPELYLRQLPIPVHTKFIEGNVAVLQSLLDFLIPDHIRDANQKRFAERYFLRYDEPLIRMRFLDNRLSPKDGLSDISIPLSDFETFEIAAKNVLITENKMNFLCLPNLPSSIAIWSGGGFNISYVKNIARLNEKEIYYWGDIDEHGFLILHQLRTYYPHTKSILMDRITFGLFKQFAVVGSRNYLENLCLTDEENATYRALKSVDNNRLEQEKIPQEYIDKTLIKILK